MALRELHWGATQDAVSPEWTTGVVLLVLTKMTDLFTTILGLAVVDGLVEKNPVGAWLYGEIGVAGLVGASLIGVLVVVLVVESVESWIATQDDCSFESRHLYLISYLPLIIVYSLATIHNSLLLLGQVG